MFEIKQELTTDNILNKITDYDIFKYYCQNFKTIGEKFKSEFRKDSAPSCVISEFNKKLWYKDFGTSNKAVDCFGYIMLKYKMSFLQALGIINIDFRLNLKPYIANITNPEILGIPETHKNVGAERIDNQFRVKLFEPVLRDWLYYDVKYWKHNYYIDVTRTERFYIYPISSLYIEGKEVMLDFPAYCYLVDWEDGIKYYKIYSPFSKNLKWLGNCKSWQYLGFNSLPWIGDKLVITKSLKDVVVLSLFNIPSIAVQSESQIISYTMYKKLKERFNKLYVLYDNDRAGKDGANTTIEIFKDINMVFIPESSNTKDISDFIHKYRFVETNKLVKTLFEI